MTKIRHKNKKIAFAVITQKERIAAVEVKDGKYVTTIHINPDSTFWIEKTEAQEPP